MTTTYADIAAEIDTAVKAGGAELAEGIDVDAITSEFIDRYGLISIDAKDEDGDQVVDHDEFWALVRKHDATQQREGVSYTETFDPGMDYRSDLALPHALDQRLDEALHGDHRDKVRDEVRDVITSKIQLHGVNTETGEWYGDWSAEAIVTEILDRYDA